MLSLNENKDILVASSNVFPIYPVNRFNTPVTQLAQEAGDGWFSDTPEQYGLESLFESKVDENGLIKPKNVPTVLLYGGDLFMKNMDILMRINLEARPTMVCGSNMHQMVAGLRI